MGARKLLYVPRRQVLSIRMYLVLDQPRWLVLCCWGVVVHGLRRGHVLGRRRVDVHELPRGWLPGGFGEVVLLHVPRGVVQLRDRCNELLDLRCGHVQ